MPSTLLPFTTGEAKEGNEANRKFESDTLVYNCAVALTAGRGDSVILAFFCYSGFFSATPVSFCHFLVGSLLYSALHVFSISLLLYLLRVQLVLVSVWESLSIYSVSFSVLTEFAKC